MALSFSKDYPVGVLVVSSFGFGDDYCKGNVGPKTNHLIYQRVGLWIGGGDFLSLHNRGHLSTRNSYKERYYCSSNTSREDHYGYSGGG